MSRIPLRICTFKGSQNLALYVAREQGFFAAHGLELDLTYTAGSAPQIAGLARGEYDLIQTAPDNVVNANSNPAAFGLDPASMPRIAMLLGGSVGPLYLCARQDVATVADLRGATIGVDNPTSGFALVLRDMLARHGLAEGLHYHVALAGGTSNRLDALTAGNVAATILYAPYNALAEEAGFRTLAVSTTYYTAYASLAMAGLARWVEAHGDQVTHVIAAALLALQWIYDQAHAAEAQDLLRHELQIAPTAAAHAYAAFIDPLTGFGKDAALDEAGLRQVIALRAAVGGAPGQIGLPAEHMDLRWYHQALPNAAGP